MSAHCVQYIVTTARIRDGTCLWTLRLRTIEIDIFSPVLVVGETTTFECLLRVVDDVLQIDVVSVVDYGAAQLGCDQGFDFLPVDEAKSTDDELHEENDGQGNGEELEFNIPDNDFNRLNVVGVVVSVFAVFDTAVFGFVDDLLLDLLMLSMRLESLKGN